MDRKSRRFAIRKIKNKSFESAIAKTQKILCDRKLPVKTIKVGNMLDLKMMEITAEWFNYKVCFC